MPLKSQIQKDDVYLLVQFVDTMGQTRQMVPSDCLDDVADSGAGFAGGPFSMGQTPPRMT